MTTVQLTSIQVTILAAACFLNTGLGGKPVISRMLAGLALFAALIGFLP